MDSSIESLSKVKKSQFDFNLESIKDSSILHRRVAERFHGPLTRVLTHCHHNIGDYFRLIMILVMQMAHSLRDGVSLCSQH